MSQDTAMALNDALKKFLEEHPLHENIVIHISANGLITIDVWSQYN